MGMQYTDMVYQRDKYKKKYEEEKIKNASLEKEIQRMRERHKELNNEMLRLERMNKSHKTREQLESSHILTTSVSRVMATLGVCIDGLDDNTISKILSE